MFAHPGDYVYKTNLHFSKDWMIDHLYPQFGLEIHVHIKTAQAQTTVILKPCWKGGA